MCCNYITGIDLRLVCSWFIKSFILQKLAVDAVLNPIGCDKVMLEIMTFFEVSHSRQATQITMYSKHIGDSHCNLARCRVASYPAWRSGEGHMKRMPGTHCLCMCLTSENRILFQNSPGKVNVNFTCHAHLTLGACTSEGYSSWVCLCVCPGKISFYVCLRQSFVVPTVYI